MLPQLDIGGGTPSPRKDSAPSTTMVTATPSRKKASSGRNTFGSSSRSRMRAWRGAERLGRDHEFAPRQSQRCRARHAHEGGNAEHAEDAGEIEDRLAEIGGHREREDQRRKRQQHVHAADHQRFEPAAEIAGEHAERAAERKADHRREQPDRQRHPRAEDQPGEFVAAEPVGAEPVLRGERRAPLQHVHVDRTLQRQHAAKIATRHDNRARRSPPEQQCRAGAARRTGSATASSCSSSSVAMADPRIEHGVEHVDDEIHR